MRFPSLCLLPSSWHSSAGFPYPFAAIARGPLAFATRWIWAAYIAESIETAAVRAPLCLRFPLLLSSVQAGVGLLNPPPTPARRVHPPVLPSVAESAAAIRLASAAASDAQRSAALRQLRPRRAMPRLHGLLPRRIQFSILSSVVAADGRLSRVMRPRRQSVFVRSGAGRSRILWSRVSDRARAAVASCGREWRWWELFGDSPLSPPRPVMQRCLLWPLP